MALAIETEAIAAVSHFRMLRPCGPLLTPIFDWFCLFFPLFEWFNPNLFCGPGCDFTGMMVNVEGASSLNGRKFQLCSA